MSDSNDNKKSVKDLGDKAPLEIKAILDGEYLPADKPKAGRPKGATKDQKFSKRGSNRHEPNDVQRQTVLMHSVLGTPKQQIAKLIGVSLKVLQKHYADELELGISKANEMVASKLFDKAVNKNDVTAQIFWLKANAGWSDKQQVKWEADDNANSPVNSVKIEVIGDDKGDAKVKSVK